VVATATPWKSGQPPQVAYAFQFYDRIVWAHWGMARINARLCRIGRFNPDEWEFPPNPKWMRWRTYNRVEENSTGTKQHLTKD
jgi:hypothetical protein